MRNPAFLLLTLCLIALPAACRSPEPPTPTLPPAWTATASLAAPSISQADLLLTRRAEILAESAAVTPTAPPTRDPSAPTTAPRPTDTPLPPEPITVNRELLPTTADTPLPAGAIAQLGIGRVRVASVSPDNRYLVIVINETPYLYRADTLDRLWAAHTSGIVTWLADGQRVGIGSTVYDLATGADSVSLPLDASRVAWSPDGTLASTHDEAGTMVVWNTATGARLWSVPGPEDIGFGRGWIADMAFSPDSQMIATTYKRFQADLAWHDDRAHLFAARTGEALAVLEGPWAPTGLVWSPDSAYLAMYSGGSEASARVWDIHTGEAVFSHEVDYLAWSPVGCRVAVTDDDFATIWDCAAGEEIQRIDGVAGRVVWSPDGSLLAGVGVEEGDWTGFEVWSAEDGREIASLDHLAPLYDFGPDGQTLLTGIGVWSNAVGILDIATDRYQPNHIRGYTGINDLVWSPDGSQIANIFGALTSQEPGIALWNIQNGQPVLTIDTDYDDTRTPDHHYALDWTVDGQWIGVVPAGPEASAQVFDLDGDRLLYEVASRAQGVAFSPDGARLAVQVPAGLSVYDTANGRQTDPFGGEMGLLMDFAWSPDSAQMAIASVENDDYWDIGPPSGLVTVYDVTTAQPLYTLSGLEGPALSVAWSPDGSRIAASTNTRVAIWNAGADSAAPALTLFSNIERAEYSRLGLTEIDWSPDGMRIAAAYGLPITRFYCNGCGYGKPGLALVWDAATAERLYRFDAHTAEVQTVAFSPDGSILATGSLDGTILLWDVTP